MVLQAASPGDQIQVYCAAAATYPTTGNLRSVLEGLPQFDLEQLTPIHPDAAKAWQQHLQQPLQPANCCYTPPRQLHIQQHDHVPLRWQPTQPQQQQQSQAAGSLGGVLLQQDPTLWRAYQVLSFISHVGAQAG